MTDRQDNDSNPPVLQIPLAAQILVTRQEAVESFVFDLSQ
jgi:hypothetical protein